MLKRLLPLILILLLALALRAYRLTDIPPGLTHDEANHGREAIEILDGVLRYYFPLNYGSEPLYSYSVAGVMALIGEGVFALRLVNVIFGLAALAATYLWAKLAFDKTTALLTALLIAVSFWPLASSREALRAGMLPFFMVVAVWFFWQIIYGSDQPETKDSLPPSLARNKTLLVVGFAISILITLHIYLAARVAWLLFPIFLIYLLLVDKERFLRSYKPILAGLLLAGILSLPMFVYLANNPQSQTRLSMLGSTLQQLQQGNWGPVVENSLEALLAFVWPGYGDQFLAYNIPGRPVFDGVTALFFIIGITTCLWRWKWPSYALVIIWFLCGIIPSLITGPTANTTRNLAAFPAVFLLPSIGFITTARWLSSRLAIPERTIAIAGAVFWLAVAGSIAVRDYFLLWGQSAEVRGAYQYTLIEELAYLETSGAIEQPVVISTVYPGPAHDPSIALVAVGEPAAQLRWIDARYGLLLPEGRTAVTIVPDSTPLHPAFEGAADQGERVGLSDSDLDPGFTRYQINDQALTTSERLSPLADFGGAVHLLQAGWLPPQAGSGTTAELLTVWEVVNPSLVGPIHPPTETTEAIFFTHVLDTEGEIIAQRDALDVPSWGWQKGDIILQIHPVIVPSETEPGTYTTVVGVYDGPTGQRLPVHAAVGAAGATVAEVSPLQFAQSP